MLTNTTRALMVARLLLYAQGSVAAITWGQSPTEAARFDPRFRNDVHAMREEDAGIVHVLKRRENGRFSISHLLVVHGKFIGDENEAAVVTALTPASGGDSLSTFVLSKDVNGWRLRSHDDSVNAAYCRVIPASTQKDLLLCQTNFAGPSGRYGTGEVDTNLYVLDFTRSPPDSFILQLKDTVSAGSRCVSWADLKSVEFQTDLLRVVVEYGRDRLAASEVHEFTRRALRFRGSPPDFVHHPYLIAFRLDPAGFSLLASSVENFQYVQERWHRGKECPAASDPAK